MDQTRTIPMSAACQRLGLSWNRVWNLVLTGKICGEKVDGRWMLSVADVETERQRRSQSLHGEVARQIARQAIIEQGGGTELERAADDARAEMESAAAIVADE
jgi:hypothetical protein